MKEIPLFIFHIGNQEYFRKCVSHNSKKNKVYVMGNDSTKDLFPNNKNVNFIHVKDVDNGEVNRLKMCFKNYSTHDVSYEIKCFLRVFYLKQLMLKTGIDSFFHLDSDCIVFDNISEVFHANPQIKNAYSVQKFCEETNPYHMVGCIHNGLITLDLCNTFINLCFDIYENKSKFHLINGKIQHHKNNMGGGICDMTFFWLIHSEKLCQVYDLNDIIIYEDEECIFDHNVNNDYGIFGENTYNMNEDNIKEIIIKDGKRYVSTKNGDKILRLLSIHFAGPAKKMLESMSI